MYFCPNCGAQLVFDIESQRLTCRSCGSSFSNEELDQISSASAEESQESITGQQAEDWKNEQIAFEESSQQSSDDLAGGMMSVNVFRCPQCGGEVYSTENSINGFCSYCGAHTSFESRIQKVQKPELIIPFQVTKDKCRESYKKKVSRSIFTDNDYKNEKKMDKFRGIYIPYWFYDFDTAGHFEASGKSSHRSGDYIIETMYGLSGDVAAQYKGNAHDASSEFDDELSESIAPYEVRGIKYFDPGFLAGYYADSPDVDEKVYRDDAFKFVNSNIAKKIQGQFTGCTVTDPNQAAASVMRNGKMSVRSGLCPVWFASYRNKDRVAYAVINGQTGKAAVDLTVNRAKLIIAGIAAAIPIWILLNLFFTFIPSTVTMLSMVISIVVMGIFAFNMSRIKERDEGFLDQGGIYRREVEERGRPGDTINRVNKAVNKKDRNTTRVILTIVMILVCFGSGFAGVTGGHMLKVIMGVGSALAGLWIIGWDMTIKTKYNKKLVLILQYIPVAISAAILLVNPFRDIIYYIADMLIYITVTFSLITITGQFNLLATRPLPQLARKGGDDSAY